MTPMTSERRRSSLRLTRSRICLLVHLRALPVAGEADAVADDEAFGDAQLFADDVDCGSLAVECRTQGMDYDSIATCFWPLLAIFSTMPCWPESYRDEEPRVPPDYDFWQMRGGDGGRMTELCGYGPHPNWAIRAPIGG